MLPWLSPLLLLFVAVVWLLAAALRGRRASAVAAAIWAVFALALMTPVLANLLVRMVEARVDDAGVECEEPEVVVLLSGGLRRAAIDRFDSGALTADSLDRVFGLRQRGLASRLPLLVSGGGHGRIGGASTVSEAEVIGELLVQLQVVDRGALLLETASQSTWDNAREVRALLPDSIDRVVLASSALHLPRARLVFERAGFEVCEWPLFSRHVDAWGWQAWMPQSSGLAKSEFVIHELAGELWYRLRIGWRQAFGDDEDRRAPPV